MTVSIEIAKAEANTRYILSELLCNNAAPNNGMHPTAVQPASHRELVWSRRRLRGG